MQAHVRGGDVDTPHGHVVVVVLVIAAGADRVPVHDEVPGDIELDRAPVHFVHPVFLEHDSPGAKHVHISRSDVDQAGILRASVNSAGVIGVGLSDFQQPGHVDVHLVGSQAGCVDRQAPGLHRHFAGCVPRIVGQVNLAVGLDVEVVRDVQIHRAAVRGEELEITLPLALRDGGTAGLQV